jgi:phytol kinase
LLLQNLIALIVTFGISLAWLRINDAIAQRGWVGSRTSRKIIHIGTGPFFVLCWLLFNNAPYARYMAALVPLAITIQFALVGSGLIKDRAAVQAMSRSGDPREILRGPLYYGIVFVVLTIAFWKDHPAGSVALMMLCGGDGLAEILGRTFGKKSLPWNRSKSWLGSAGFLIGGWLLSLIVLGIFITLGVFKSSFMHVLLPTSTIAFACTLVESISPHDLDNITVPLAATALGLLLF